MSTGSLSLFAGYPVLHVRCVWCDNLLADKGMSGCMISAWNVEPVLCYSTKQPLETGVTELPGTTHDFPSRHCLCFTTETACTVCGNVIGYRVLNPCLVCKISSTNGHTWVFLSCNVYVQGIRNGDRALTWGDLRQGIDHEVLLPR